MTQKTRQVVEELKRIELERKENRRRAEEWREARRASRLTEWERASLLSGQVPA